MPPEDLDALLEEMDGREDTLAREAEELRGQLAERDQQLAALMQVLADRDEELERTQAGLRRYKEDALAAAKEELRSEAERKLRERLAARISEELRGPLQQSLRAELAPQVREEVRREILDGMSEAERARLLQPAVTEAIGQQREKLDAEFEARVSLEVRRRTSEALQREREQMRARAADLQRQKEELAEGAATKALEARLRAQVASLESKYAREVTGVRREVAAARKRCADLEAAAAASHAEAERLKAEAADGANKLREILNYKEREIRRLQGVLDAQEEERRARVSVAVATERGGRGVQGGSAAGQGLGQAAGQAAGQTPGQPGDHPGSPAASFGASFAGSATASRLSASLSPSASPAAAARASGGPGGPGADRQALSGTALTASVNEVLQRSRAGRSPRVERTLPDEGEGSSWAPRATGGASSLGATRGVGGVGGAASSASAASAGIPGSPGGTNGVTDSGSGEIRFSSAAMRDVEQRIQSDLVDAPPDVVLAIPAAGRPGGSPRRPPERSPGRPQERPAEGGAPEAAKPLEATRSNISRGPADPVAQGFPERPEHPSLPRQPEGAEGGSSFPAGAEPPAGQGLPAPSPDPDVSGVLLSQFALEQEEQAVFVNSPSICVPAGRAGALLESALQFLFRLWDRIEEAFLNRNAILNTLRSCLKQGAVEQALKIARRELIRCRKVDTEYGEVYDLIRRREQLKLSALPGASQAGADPAELSRVTEELARRLAEPGAAAAVLYRSVPYADVLRAEGAVVAPAGGSPGE